MQPSGSSHLAGLYCAPTCRPDQANRATAGTSASSNGVIHGTGCQSNKLVCAVPARGSASVRPTPCAIEASGQAAQCGFLEIFRFSVKMVRWFQTRGPEHRAVEG